MYNSATGVWTRSNLSQARWSLAATSVGNVAFFAGGLDCLRELSNVIDMYNSTSGLWLTLQLVVARQLLAAMTIGNVALFAGGQASVFRVFSLIGSFV